MSEKLRRIDVTYQKLEVEAFGRQLIETGDLDPVYIALNGCEWDEERRQRWLMAYWLFYHPGAASYMADAPTEQLFWNRVVNAARNETPTPLDGRWPRASERRHFRGQKAIDAVARLRQTPLPDTFAALERAAPDYKAVAKVVCSLPQFGPWMAWKVADMMERCMGIEMDFNLSGMLMFEDPRKAAVMVALRGMGLPDTAKLKDEPGTIQRVVDHLLREYVDLSAPPGNDRPINIQEVETVLCKYKSHLNGHYPVGKDVREIREGLSSWASVSESAKEFLWAMPKVD